MYGGMSQNYYRAVFSLFLTKVRFNCITGIHVVNSRQACRVAQDDEGNPLGYAVVFLPASQVVLLLLSAFMFNVHRLPPFCVSVDSPLPRSAYYFLPLPIPPGALLLILNIPPSPLRP